MTKTSLSPLDLSQIPKLSFDDVLQKLRTPALAARSGYLAMYSSWLGGIVKDPQLMFVPVDDHIVHRGDGVFEAIKCVDGRIYALDRHLERLLKSAEMISLTPPHTLEELRTIAIETVRASGAHDCYIRLYVSRGPGGFTANPYESIGSQLYLVITPYRPMAQEKYEQGTNVLISYISIKEGFFSTVKSCNYLPNVLMKKEAVDAGVDFTISRDEKGYLAEGSTENFGIISKSGELWVPGFERTLKGVTAYRVMELAEKLVAEQKLKAVLNAHIKEEDVREAREAMMFGTTLDCLPVTKFQGRAIADGKVGPITRELLSLLRVDMVSGPLVHHI